MVISLPWLWLAGHMAAAIGTLLLLVQLVRPSKGIAAAGTVGGVAACAALAYILSELNQSFGGIYRGLAWGIAFLAGYAVIAGALHVASAFRARERHPALPRSASMPVRARQQHQ